MIKAVKITKLSKISRQSVNKIIKNIRILIAKEYEKISKMQGETKVDESYFCFVTLVTASRSGYAKHRLSKFKGIKKENLLLHLKEASM